LEFATLYPNQSLLVFIQDAKTLLHNLVVMPGG